MNLVLSDCFSKQMVRLSIIDEAISIVRWMAPELFSSSSLYTTSTDVYSLGMTLFTIIEGKVPFSNVNELDIVAKVKRGERPTFLQPNVDEKIKHLITWCVKQNAVERPSTAELLNYVITNFGVNLNSPCVSNCK